MLSVSCVFNDVGAHSLRMFGGLPETGQTMREVFKSGFGLDSSGNIELRKEIALLLSVWKKSRTQHAMCRIVGIPSYIGAQQRRVQNTKDTAMPAEAAAQGRSLTIRKQP